MKKITIIKYLVSNVILLLIICLINLSCQSNNDYRAIQKALNLAGKNQVELEKVFKHYENVDIAIASAAVADYAPKEIATEKIKKNDDSLTLELVKNPDILKTMGEKKSHQFLVGFALETQNEEENAKGKLQKKNLDMIVLNSLQDEGAGFKQDTNKIKIITESTLTEFPLKSNSEVAKDILNFVEAQILK